jgi:hypothetical protein
MSDLRHAEVPGCPHTDLEKTIGVIELVTPSRRTPTLWLVTRVLDPLVSGHEGRTGFGRASLSFNCEERSEA